MSELQAINSVYNIEIEKIDPNPNQPRKHFSNESLHDLAESIRRYGVMQPITVFKRESETADGVSTRYEIIAGERRWRASIKAGMSTIPAIIHDGPQSEQDRFELSILENLQREDLNPTDKARSFARLANEFGMKHAEIADRLGKSREYVTNALRLLALPDNILDALSAGKISEGHTRPLVSLKDRPDELQTVFTEIVQKGLTVREAESLVRRATGRTKKSHNQSSSTHHRLDPEMQDIQERLSGALGTSVSIDTKAEGGKLTIDFFSPDDLKKLLAMVDTAPQLPHQSNSKSPQTDQVVTTTPEPQHVTPRPQTDPLVSSPTTVGPVPADPARNNVHTNDVLPENQPTDTQETAQTGTEPTLSASANHSVLGDDFTINVRGSDVLEPEMTPQQGNTPPVGRDEQVANNAFAPTEPIPSTAAMNMQAEIDRLVSDHSSEASTLELPTDDRVSVDLGDFEINPPQEQVVVTDDLTQQGTDTPTNASILGQMSQGALAETHGVETSTKAGTQDTQSRSVPSDEQSPEVPHAMQNFVPHAAQEFNSQVAEFEMMSAGSDFVPQEENTNNDETETQTAPVSAHITMGGLGGSEPSDPSPPPSSTSTISKEKYPDGDPYRLDNFSV